MHAWKVNAYECVSRVPNRKYIMRVCVCMEHVLALSVRRVCVFVDQRRWSFLLNMGWYFQE